MTFVTDSNRPQPLWQPPPTACLTASGAASEVPSLSPHPWTALRGFLCSFAAAGGKEQFIKHMLHPSAPEMFETLALEFVARVLHWKGMRDGSVVTWEMVMEYWHRYSHNPDPNCPEEQRELESSHWAPEAHCPYSMPLSYVEHVVMSEETYNDTFTLELQRALKYVRPSGRGC